MRARTTVRLLIRDAVFAARLWIGACVAGAGLGLLVLVAFGFVGCDKPAARAAARP